MALDTPLVTITRTTDFPTAWTLPEDSGAPYMFDRMHFPFPAPQLEQDTIGVALAHGFTAAARGMHLPIQGMEVVYRNYYRFERYVMVEPASEDEARRINADAEASFQMEVGRMIERWHGEHLPALLAYHRRMAELEVPGASPRELVTLLAEMDTIQRDIWAIHFKVAMPLLLAMQIFDEFYAEVFGGTEAEAHAMLPGALSESIKAGFGLSDLTNRVRELGLEEMFLDTPSDELMPALGQSVRGREFLARLDDYLADYGLRQDLFQLTVPTWQEDPSVALATIRGYLRSGHDARAEHADVTRAAEEALAVARDTLAAFPEAVRGQFETLLQFARQGSFLQEEHNFYIDQQALARLRLFYVQVGRRMVDLGLLADADDLFLLGTAEIQALLTGDDVVPASVLQTRRDELATAATLTPPPFVGQPPAGPPAQDNPVARAMVRFFGGPPQQAETPGELRGNAGSRGTVTGPARVVRTLEEATAVEPGEILVAVTTMPAWTPLFGIAAAVVTETGGVLSHCAIVAREYGIPAVVGAHGATQVIVTGQQVTVDGTTGRVVIAG